MVYEPERKSMGLTISISSHRKNGNGAVGGGRKNTTGKKAVITQEGSERVTLTGSTVTDLLREIRKKFNIPHTTQINRKGETRI
ncbi:MAG: hypothetical protein WAZ40_03655 [Minisyncoccia bacterium]